MGDVERNLAALLVGTASGLAQAKAERRIDTTKAVLSATFQMAGDGIDATEDAEFAKYLQKVGGKDVAGVIAGLASVNRRAMMNKAEAKRAEEAQQREDAFARLQAFTSGRRAPGAAALAPAATGQAAPTSAPAPRVPTQAPAVPDQVDALFAGAAAPALAPEQPLWDVEVEERLQGGYRPGPIDLEKGMPTTVVWSEPDDQDRKAARFRIAWLGFPAFLGADTDADLAARLEQAGGREVVDAWLSKMTADTRLGMGPAEAQELRRAIRVRVMNGIREMPEFRDDPAVALVLSAALTGDDSEIIEKDLETNRQLQSSLELEKVRSRNDYSRSAQLERDRFRRDPQNAEFLSRSGGKTPDMMSSQAALDIWNEAGDANAAKALEDMREADLFSTDPAKLAARQLYPGMALDQLGAVELAAVQEKIKNDKIRAAIEQKRREGITGIGLEMEAKHASLKAVVTPILAPGGELDQLREWIPLVNPATNKGSLQVQRFRNWLLGPLGETNLNLYNGYIKSTAGIFARNLSGEGSRLTEGDIERILAILPNQNDLYDTAIKKLEIVTRAFTLMEQGQADQALLYLHGNGTVRELALNVRNDATYRKGAMESFYGRELDSREAEAKWSDMVRLQAMNGTSGLAEDLMQVAPALPSLAPPSGQDNSLDELLGE